MNDAKKIREIEKLYFFECKENEDNKVLLNKTLQQYSQLKEFCKLLLETKTTDDFDMAMNYIRYHLENY